MNIADSHQTLASGGRIPLLLLCLGLTGDARSVEPDLARDRLDSSAKVDKAMPTASTAPRVGTKHPKAWRQRLFHSVQVNVDAKGDNILGDVANQPSIAVDPTNPDRIVIGWHQFESVDSYSPRAGWAYSHDGGESWTFPGLMGSELPLSGPSRRYPVLSADAHGNIHYCSYLYVRGSNDLFTSSDGGVTWIVSASRFGGHGTWMAIDRTGGRGRNNIYAFWSNCYNCQGEFSRSIDGGQSFDEPQPLPGYLRGGTLDVGPNGALYILDTQLRVIRSDDPWLETGMPAFINLGVVDLCQCTDCTASGSIAPNPGTTAGQAWIAVDRSDATTRGDVYALQSLCRDDDPADVMFSRSTDRGGTWSRAVRVNDDQGGTNAWQWFGMMAVAPHGRIDVVWNDTRNSGAGNLSELFYSFSGDGGFTWSTNVALSPVFDSHVGRPGQGGIGSNYHMVSSDRGPSIAYTATFNGEQDIYFLRFDVDCDGNGIADADETAGGSADDCNGNFLPDVCETDEDGDGLIHGCDADLDNDGVTNESDVCLLTPLAGPSDGEGRPFSDTNLNCSVDLTDYIRFRNCLGAGGPDVGAPPATCLSVFDYNDDGHVDLRDAAGFSIAFSGDP